MTIRAVYENGVFKPIEPVDLPEHTNVVLHAEPVEGSARQDYDAVWACLANPVETGVVDLSERHDEHQP